MKISLDLGRVVFNNALTRQPYGKTAVMQLMPDCLKILQQWSAAGQELSVISKIDPHTEARVTMSLVHAGILPFLIDPAEVRFCYERKDKGPIAAMTKPLVHIDDRVEPMEAIHAAGVPYKILFTGLGDSRDEFGPLSFGEKEGLFIAKDWQEVERIVASLPSA